MEKTTISAPEVTHDLINEWKQKYGEVHLITIAESSKKYDPLMLPDDEDAPIVGGLQAYIRKPNDKELAFAMSKLPAFMEAGKVIIKNCWLAGDEQIKTDPALLTAAALQVVEFITVRQTQLKKL